MHSSCAVETPPVVSAPAVFGHGRMSSWAVDVSMTPLPFRSVHPPVLACAIRTTLEPSRLATQTAPFLSTAVREGPLGCPNGALKYSPRILPESLSILTTVPLLVTATHRKLSW